MAPCAHQRAASERPWRWHGAHAPCVARQEGPIMHEARQGVPLKPAALPLSHPRPVRTPQHDSSPPLHSFLYSVFFPLLDAVSLCLFVIARLSLRLHISVWCWFTKYAQNDDTFSTEVCCLEAIGTFPWNTKSCLIDCWCGGEIRSILD